jgi:hypothetical protein
MAMRENSSFPGLPDQEGEPGQSVVRHALAPEAMRIGDAERDVAMQELGEHFVAGRLTHDELDERLGLVLSTRTHGQLARVMADLPAPRLPATRRPAADDRAGTLASGSTVPATAVPATMGPASPAAVSALAASAHREQAPGDNVSRIAAVALLLFAMLIWLFTVMMFASLG